VAGAAAQAGGRQSETWIEAIAARERTATNESRVCI
jgi:hypothetical protein